MTVECSKKVKNLKDKKRHPENGSGLNMTVRGVSPCFFLSKSHILLMPEPPLLKPPYLPTYMYLPTRESLPYYIPTCR